MENVNCACCGLVINRADGTVDNFGEIFCRNCAVYLDGDAPPSDEVQRLINVAIALVDLLNERDTAIALERQETGSSGVSFIAMGIKATLLELELWRAVKPFKKAKTDTSM